MSGENPPSRDPGNDQHQNASTYCTKTHQRPETQQGENAGQQWVEQSSWRWLCPSRRMLSMRWSRRAWRALESTGRVLLRTSWSSSRHEVGTSSSSSSSSRVPAKQQGGHSTAVSFKRPGLVFDTVVLHARVVSLGVPRDWGFDVVHYFPVGWRVSAVC